MAKYRVDLTDEERSELRSLISKGAYKHTKLKRAQILLGCDESEGGKKMSDKEVSHAYDVGLRTVERTRKRFVPDGYKEALHGKPRPVNRKKVLDGRVESHLIALRCSEVSEGHNKWSLRLLADKMVELEYVEAISHQSVSAI